MTGYLNFSESEIKKVPEAEGVYVLAKPSGFGVVVIYVGRSDDLQRRLLEHLNSNDRCINQATRFAYETTSRSEERERELLESYKTPECNG